jgi:hypothetical protein
LEFFSFPGSNDEQSEIGRGVPGQMPHWEESFFKKKKDF